MKIVIVEIAIWGHRKTYLELLARAFLEIGHDVTLISPLAGQDFSDLNFSRTITIDDYWLGPVNRYGLKGRKLLKDKWKYVQGQVVNHKDLVGDFDFVFFPYVDELVDSYLTNWELNWIFPFPWIGLYMNPKNFRRKYSYAFLRRGPFDPNDLLRTKYCRGLLTLDVKGSKWIETKYGKKSGFVPDAVDLAEPDFEFSGVKLLRVKSKGRKVILLLGFLQRRKGIMALISLLEEQEFRDVLVAIVGDFNEKSFHPEELKRINNLVESNRDDFFFLSQKLPGEPQFNAFMSICDVVYAAYDGFPFSSNLLTKAAFFNKPIIVSEGGQMEELTRKYNLGEVVEFGDTTSLLSAIKSALSPEKKYFFLEFQKRFSFYSFKKAIDDLLKSVALYH